MKRQCTHITGEWVQLQSCVWLCGLSTFVLIPLLFVNPSFWIYHFSMTASPIQCTHWARGLGMSQGRSPFYHMNNTYAVNPSHLWKIPRSPSHLICMRMDCGRQHEHPQHGDNMEKSPQKLRPKSAGRFCAVTVLITYAPCPYGIIHIIHIWKSSSWK